MTEEKRFEKIGTQEKVQEGVANAPEILGTKEKEPSYFPSSSQPSYVSKDKKEKDNIQPTQVSQVSANMDPISVLLPAKSVLWADQKKAIFLSNVALVRLTKNKKMTARIIQEAIDILAKARELFQKSLKVYS